MAHEQSLDLIQRIKAHLIDLGAQCLDAEGFGNCFPPGTERADLTMFAQSLIVELKNLEVDPTERLNKAVANYYGRRDFPIVYGEVPFSEIMSHVAEPLRSEVEDKAVHEVTMTLERIVTKANRQIRATKKALGVAEAGGALIIANQKLAALSPGLIVYRLQKILKKRTDTGDFRFPEIQGICVFTEAHELKDSGFGHPLRPILIMEGVPSDRSKRVGEEINYIVKLWAQRDQSPLYRIKNASGEFLDKFTPLSE